MGTLFVCARRLLLTALSLLLVIGPAAEQVMCQQTDSAITDVIVIRADRALVVESGEMIQDAVVVVRGDRIAEFGSGLPVPENARVIDLGDHTLLPGLIDAHTHLAIQPDYSTLNPILYKSIPYRTIEAVAGAKATLMAGFTTIRDIDSEGADWADVAVRDAINNGVVPGPRMQVATLSISITGGYMNQNDLAPQIDAPHFGALIDSSDDLVPEVRRQIKNGADFIKIYATGTTRHVNLETMEPMTQFSLDDIKIVVDEAARFGKPVAAHAYGGEGARNAVLAGVRSIEHGMLLDDEIMKLMIERGTFWVPTFSVYMEDGPRSGWSERARKLVESHEKAFRRALQLGVKIAYGTDAGALPHGDNAIDFGIMVDYGMTPLQAIQSATIHAADLMGMSGDVGTLSAGAFADVIAVTGNPLDDVTLLGDVEFVMKGGTVYRAP